MRSIPVELDDETIRLLAALGEPTEVLARMAKAAADGVRRPGRPRRDATDSSLRLEREKADDAIASERDHIERAADEVVRLARHRADELLQTARDVDEEGGSPSPVTRASSARARARADDLLEDERSDADSALQHERAERKRGPADSLVGERAATDKDLLGERAHIDTLLVDQREANEQLLHATIRAQDLAIVADAAKARAEQSEQELRVVAEFREMFLGILGHDLRNPLASIVASAAVLLRKGNLDDKDAVTVARIIRNSQRMTRMIAQLLDTTRARLGGGLPFEAAPMDLQDVCRNVIEEFEVAVQLETEGDLRGVWDADRLAEVLSNLTGNAIEYAAPGTTVLLAARGDDAGVVVEISNRGEPIPDDVLPFVFEPFRRARQRAKSSTGNLGLGLYISREIVLSHGGTLEARSAGGTTTFVMRLPRRAPTPAS